MPRKSVRNSALRSRSAKLNRKLLPAVVRGVLVVKGLYFQWSVKIRVVALHRNLGLADGRFEPS
jgi:hypothetical protein